MTLRLTVDESVWRSHLAAVAEPLGHRMIPVVKGNGYGFGRARLARLAAEWRPPFIAIGTIFELDGLLDDIVGVLVLTPSLDERLADLPAHAIPTVATHRQAAHVLDVLGPGRPTVVKVASTMLRHGFAPGDLPEGLHAVAYAIHPPIAGSSAEHIEEIESLLPRLDPAVSVHVSHLDVASFLDLTRRHAGRELLLRLGTTLWHGDKSMLSLTADVLDTRRVTAGTPAGYRQTAVPTDGTVVIIGAGSAHGVVPLPDGRSPFHFARERLALLEAPHMHVSMAFVPDGQTCPDAGESVDVQRPLISVAADQVIFA